MAEQGIRKSALQSFARWVGETALIDVSDYLIENPRTFPVAKVLRKAEMSGEAFRKFINDYAPIHIGEQTLFDVIETIAQEPKLAKNARFLAEGGILVANPENQRIRTIASEYRLAYLLFQDYQVFQENDDYLRAEVCLRLGEQTLDMQCVVDSLDFHSPSIPRRFPPPRVPVEPNAGRHALPEGFEVVGKPVLGGLHHEYRLERIAA